MGNSPFPSPQNRRLRGAHGPCARIAAVLLEVVGLGAVPGFCDPRNLRMGKWLNGDFNGILMVIVMGF